MQSPSHASHVNHAHKRVSSSTTMPVNDFPSENRIFDENENMDIDGALDNSLLSEPHRSDLR